MARRVCLLRGVAFLAVAALPLAAVVVGALAGWRTRRGVAPSVAWRRSFAEVAIVHGTVPWVWLTLIPGSGAGVVRGRVSLVPLRDLATMSDVQVVGNLLILAALGFCAPMLFPALASVPRMLVLGAACSALIETLQFVLVLDRVSSVDDVLLNAGGAGLAALASRPWWCGARDRRAMSEDGRGARRPGSDPERALPR